MWHRRMVALRVPERAADLAARHEAVALVNQHPALWPLLNEMTLQGRVDWPAVLNRLEENNREDTTARHRRAA